MRAMLTLLFTVFLCTCARAPLSGQIPPPPPPPGPHIFVDLPAELADGPLDGRLLVIWSRDSVREPRFSVTDGPETAQVFGTNVTNWRPGSAKMMRYNYSVGYPVGDIDDFPRGTYYVQAVFHRYETFERADGHTVRLPMDRGEGQQWNRAPGNLVSTPVRITTGEGFGPVYDHSISLDRKLPEIEAPEDTEWIKHVRIKSKLLSEFWGRDMYLGAHVLLPAGYAEHPDVRYPLAIMHGHFPHDFDGFRTTPPDPDLECAPSERFGLPCYNRTVQQEAYDFYRAWSGPDFPRVLAIKIQHANPYYDDSYAVNSQNLGPYGDAITYELIPYIERAFRGIGQGWARFLYGGSTGGWEALAAQVFYPDEYGTCYAACPDPIDFRAFTVVNLYEDQNAYYTGDAGDLKRTERPGRRDSLGHVSTTLRAMNLRERALGSKSRSGQQWDIWEAVYSPVGNDGYPRRIWDKWDGAIDPEVAAHWRENYDLSYIMRRDWATLGPKLRGKVHIYCGDMDNYYLNNAVYLTEAFLESTDNPPYDGEVAYGDRAEHCWNGDPTEPNAISRLRYHRMFIPKWAAGVAKLAPRGADLTSWRY